jgi:hypothetical protein
LSIDRALLKHILEERYKDFGFKKKKKTNKQKEENPKNN